MRELFRPLFLGAPATHARFDPIVNAVWKGAKARVNTYPFPT